MQLFASYTGPDFLVFYAGLLAAVIIAGWWIPFWLRPEGRPGALADPGEIAYLVGGTTRYVDAAIAGLLGRGGLQIAGKTKLAVDNREAAQDPAERALMRLPGNFGWSQARRAIADYAGQVDETLVRKGLLIERGERFLFRLMPTLPYAALAALGLYRRQAGEALGEPTGLLTMMLFATLAFGLMRLFAVNPRTQAGNDVVTEARRNAARLRSAPTRGETGLAVGLFGTGVLVGSPFAPYHTMRQGSGDGGSSGGDGDGGSGCGGGCGGCGG